MDNVAAVRRGFKYGCALGMAYVVNVQVLTWLGLGLTSWVILFDLVLLSVAVFALQWRERKRRGTVPGAIEALVSVGLMVFTAGLILQSYMVIYLVFIDPSWVDRVVEIRRDLLTAAGVADGEIRQRVAAIRSGFTPARMWTIGVLIPALWKLGFALVLTVSVLYGLARTGRQRDRAE